MDASRGPSDVEAALGALGIPWRATRARGSTAVEAAQSLGVELGAIVKSLLFLADDEPVLVLVGGDRRADPQQLARLLAARKVKIASPEWVMAETGFPPGAVPPVGHTRPLPVWIDAGLAAHPIVYTSGGASDLLIALGVEELLAATGGRIAEVSEG